MSELVMFNDIIIYDFLNKAHMLQFVTEIYSLIWRNFDEIVNISETDWMLINTIFETKLNFFKIYSLSSEDRELVDNEFDDLHRENKIK